MSVFLVKCKDGKCCAGILELGFSREIFFSPRDARAAVVVADTQRKECAPHRIDEYVAFDHHAEAKAREAVKEERRRIRAAIGALSCDKAVKDAVVAAVFSPAPTTKMEVKHS